MHEGNVGKGLETRLADVEYCTTDASAPVDQLQHLTENQFIISLFEVMNWPYIPSADFDVDQVILQSLAFWRKPLPKCYACELLSIQHDREGTDQPRTYRNAYVDMNLMQWKLVFGYLCNCVTFTHCLASHYSSCSSQTTCSAIRRSL